MLTKKQLAIQLSKLAAFEKPKIKLEQYTTESEIAATILWDALMKGDIVGKTVADLGAGTGILGIGSLLLGAKHVFFIEKDTDAVRILQTNILPFRATNYEICQMDVREFQQKVDTIFQNPPFGTRQEHADKIFLEKAFSLSNIIYSFHKTATETFVRAIAKDYSFTVVESYMFAFPLRQTYAHQTKKRELIEVTCYRMIKR